MNKRDLLIVYIITALVMCASYALAAAVEIKPKDVPNCENFTPRELKIIQKEVDAGHQPWRSDPVSYAKLFMKFYYPKLDVNEMETASAKVKFSSKGKRAAVTIDYNGKTHTTLLHKAFPSNKDSIWVVEKMYIRPVDNNK